MVQETAAWTEENDEKVVLEIYSPLCHVAYISYAPEDCRVISICIGLSVFLPVIFSEEY